jgi:hypothetical protein
VWKLDWSLRESAQWMLVLEVWMYDRLSSMRLDRVGTWDLGQMPLQRVPLTRHAVSFFPRFAFRSLWLWLRVIC